MEPHNKRCLIRFIVYELEYLEYNADLVHLPVGESLPDDSDPFQNTVTPELLKDEIRLDNPRLLLHVGQDTSAGYIC